MRSGRVGRWSCAALVGVLLLLTGCARSHAGSASSAPVLSSTPAASPSAGSPSAPPPSAGSPSATTPSALSPSAVPPSPSLPSARPGAAPGRPGTYGVAELEIGVERAGRDVPTSVWYPRSRRDGGYPVVLFSHGLFAEPADYRALLTSWASRGIVVVAPRYPFTNRRAAQVDPTDVVRQPADASAALDRVLALARTSGSALAGRVDGDHVVAVGHSLGAITTVGLLSDCCREPRLRGAVVLAGNGLGFDGFAGTAVPVLFVHGDADPVVPYRSARALYAQVPWNKAFLTLPGQGHTVPFLRGGDAARLVEASVAAFVTSVTTHVDTAATGGPGEVWRGVRAVVAGLPGTGRFEIG